MAQVASEAGDYGAGYYSGYLGGHYDWDNPDYRAFFTHVAGRLAALVAPRTALDVGCAKGFLVGCLVDLGVDAHGVDISDYAIEAAEPRLAGRLSVANAAEGLEGRFDLVTCIETLEHMSPAEAEAAMDAICSVTDVVVVSTTPGDFDEPTHVNVRQPHAWAASFAERGFFRRVDVDLGFLSPWAVMFTRATPGPRDLVVSYESLLFPLRSELITKRAALLDTRRALEQAEHEPALAEQLAQARHALLTARDHAIGLEAELATLRVTVATLRGSAQEAQAVHAQLAEVYGSKAWKVGRSILSPGTALRGRGAQ